MCLFIRISGKELLWNHRKIDMTIGDKILVIEETEEGTFEWDGEVVAVNDVYVETTHRRNAYDARTMAFL